MHFVLARWLGRDGYGTYSFAVAVAGLAAVMAPLGWPVILQRFVAQYIAREAWSKLVGVLVRSFQITLFAALVASAFVALAPLVVQVTPGQGTALRFAALLIPVMALVKLRRNALQGLQSMTGMLVPEEIVLPVLVIVGTVGLGLNRAEGALWLYFGAALFSFALGTVWLTRTLPPESRGVSPSYLTRAWMAIALPMLGSDLSRYLMNRTDVLLLGALEDMDAVGLYSAANRLAQLVTFLMVAVNSAAAPLLASAYGSEDLTQFRLVLRKAMLWSFLGAAPLFFVMVGIPSLLLGLFGEGFIEGASLLRILATGQLVNAMSGPVGFALIMSGRERIFAGLVAGTALLNLVGNLVAIPIWGAIGAAVVTAVTVALLNGGCFVVLRNSEVWGS